MSAPYTVKIVISNSEGQEMTTLTQKLDEYEELVAYQKALAAGIFGMADEVVKGKSAKPKA